MTDLEKFKITENLFANKTIEEISEDSQNIIDTLETLEIPRLLELFKAFVNENNDVYLMSIINTIKHIKQNFNFEETLTNEEIEDHLNSYADLTN